MSALRFWPSAMPAIAMRLPEQAGQQELQVVVPGPAADRAAEDVGEQQQEDHRLQRHVDQRLGRAPGLDQAAAGQRQAVPDQPEVPVASAVAAGGRRRRRSVRGSGWRSCCLLGVGRRLVARGAPGQGEEHLVQAGQVQGELGDADAGRRAAGAPPRAGPRRRRRRRSARRGRATRPGCRSARRGSRRPRRARAGSAGRTVEPSGRRRSA